MLDWTNKKQRDMYMMHKQSYSKAVMRGRNQLWMSVISRRTQLQQDAWYVCFNQKIKILTQWQKHIYSIASRGS